MTIVNQEEFLNKLYEVVHKLSGISKTQSYRFKKEWEENLNQTKQKPHLVRSISVEKEKFLNDIDYRIEVIDTIRLSFEDGFHTIKSLLNYLYSNYFRNFKSYHENFLKEDQIILKYFVAKKILGDLVQYNTMDHESVPLKYNILARNYAMMKFKSLRDTEINQNLSKINIKLTMKKMKKIMEEIIADGIIKKSKKGRYLYYSLKKDVELSEKAEKLYRTTIRSLVEWPTLFWRSFYNIREINVTVEDDDFKYPDFLNKALSKAATQGYSACHYVFKNLVKYYKRIKEENN